MGTILKNIVRFEGLAIGVPTSLPHLLNVNGRPVAPRIGGMNVGGFDVTADTTQITVTRQVDGLNADVDVYVEYWHTIEAVIPQLTSLAGLTPLFFAGGTGGGGGGESAFALLNFDWSDGVIASQKNIASFAVVNTGIRDFTFTSPLAPADIGRCVITVSAEPDEDDAQFQPPIQVFGRIQDVNTLRVWAYPTQANIAGNAVDPTDNLVRVYVRIDVPAIEFEVGP